MKDPFFLSSGSKSAKAPRRLNNQKSHQSNNKRKRPEQRPPPPTSKSRDRRHVADEEIEDHEDEESHDEDAAGQESADESNTEEFNETAQEKRIRLAKNYLDTLEQEKHNEMELAEDMDAEYIASRLRTEASEIKRRQFKSMAHRFTSPIQDGCIRTVKPHSKSITGVALTKDDRYLFSASKDGSLVKYNMETGKKTVLWSKANYIPKSNKKSKEQPAVTKGHTKHIMTICLSDDGQYLASGGCDKLVCIWNVESNELLATFKHHRDIVSALCFRQGTHQLFSGSFDRTIKVWNIDQLSYVETLFGHLDPVTCVASLAKDRAVSSGGRDRTLRLWKILEESQLVYRISGSGSNQPEFTVNKKDQRKDDDDDDNGGDHESPKDTEHKVMNKENNAGESETTTILKSPSTSVGIGGSVDVCCMMDEERWASGTDTGKKPSYVHLLAHGTVEHPTWITAMTCAPFPSDILISGSFDGYIKVWKIQDIEKWKGLECIQQIKMPGVINSLQLSASGKYLIAGVGQEHKYGRWIKFKGSQGVQNCVKIIALDAAQ